MPWTAAGTVQSSQIFQSGTITAAGHGTATLGPNITFQPNSSFKILFQLWNAAAFQDSVKIQLQWGDIVSNVLLGIDSFYIFGSSAAPPNAHAIMLEGPCSGTTLNVDVIGGYAANSPIFSYSVFQFVGAQFPFLQGRSLYSQSGNILTNYGQFGLPTYPSNTAPMNFVDPLAGIAEWSASVAATSILNTIMPFWNGPFTLCGSTSSGNTTDGGFQMFPNSTDAFGGTGTNTLNFAMDKQGGFCSGGYAAGNCQYLGQFNNSNAAAKTLAITQTYLSYGGSGGGFL